MAEPMILVKKADGTSVKMPLSEVKKLQKPVFQIPIPMEGGDPMSEIKKLLAVKELPAAPFEPLLEAKFAEPHLLDEALEPHEIKQPDLVAQVSYEELAWAAAKAAKINLPDILHARFHSLATSLYKGIRTVDQVLDYARLEVGNGGLGLTPAEIDRLSQTLQAVPGTPKITLRQRPAAVKSVSQMTAPALTTTQAPQTLGARAPMRDVEPPAPRPMQVMGPVEEMKSFNLTDWRRAAATPEKAREILINKFKGLQEESYFMYQDARAAWFTSPLLIQYQKTVVTALNSGARLGETHAAPPGTTLSAADISAIVEINRSLGV